MREQIAEDEHQLDRERRPARHRVVGNVARTRDELLAVRRRVEECLRFLVPETQENLIAQHSRAVEPCAIEREVVQRDGGEAKRGMILEEAGDLRNAVLVRAQYPPVSHQCAEEKFPIPYRHHRQLGVVEYPRGFGNAAQHETIPSGENLLVTSGTNAPLASVIEDAFRAVDCGAQLGERHPMSVRELGRIVLHVQNVAPLEVSLGRHAPIRG